jgi:SAM-dependent methyltransferase
MAMAPWYETLFDEDYLRLWTPNLPPERAEQELHGLLTLLDLPAGARVLDLCCGHGRHAVPLARLGYRVTGLDLSEVFLERGRRSAQEAGVEVEWLHGDMREIPFKGELDAVINMYTAFGYFEDEENLQVLRAVRNALKPGGRFLLDVIHHEGVIRRFQPEGVTRHPDGCIVVEDRKWDCFTGRCDVEMTVIEPNGTRKTLSHSVRIYALTELARMLREAGLQLEAYYGGVDGSPLTLDSRRLAILARRPAA